VIVCLETELGRPDNERKRLDDDTAEDMMRQDTSVSATPVLVVADGRGRKLRLKEMNFSGPSVDAAREGGNQHHHQLPVKTAS